MSQVEAVCWDISAGVVGTVFGQWILYVTSRSKEMSPDAIDHVGLVIFDRLYEYGDAGVLMSEDKVAPKTLDIPSRYPVSSVRSREKMGKTKKTLEEFHRWLNTQDEAAFKGSKYDVVDNSCVVWGIAACLFLGVKHPKNWDKILDWAKKNEPIANVFGKVGVHSRAGSQLISPVDLGNAKAYKKSSFMYSTINIFTSAIVVGKALKDGNDKQDKEVELDEDTQEGLI